jgi:divalent metal cation (Fe/Co/Zn/Cd) transporter
VPNDRVCRGGRLATAEQVRLLNPARIQTLRRRVRLVVAAVIAYNVVEAVTAIAAGMVASSTALVSFGLDSCVEVLSAVAIAWQFSAADPETRETAALRTVAVAFFALAIYVAVESVRALWGASEPQHSPVGIGLAAVSLVVMPVLSWVERRAGKELGSASVVSDSKQTLLCTYLSAVLLVGLVLNSLFGWAWADPFAALVIAGVAVKEGVEAWRGDSCSAPPSVVLSEEEPARSVTDDHCDHRGVGDSAGPAHSNQSDLGGRR